MNAVVVDTHAVIWALLDRSRLSAAAKETLETANRSGAPVYVPTISIVEIVYLIEKGRLPVEVKARLGELLDDQSTNLIATSLDHEIADRVEHVSRDAIPDMPDRVIAATALHLGLPLVTRDAQIRASDLKTIW